MIQPLDIRMEDTAWMGDDSAFGAGVKPVDDLFIGSGPFAGHQFGWLCRANGDPDMGEPSHWVVCTANGRDAFSSANLAECMTWAMSLAYAFVARATRDASTRV